MKPKTDRIKRAADLASMVPAPADVRQAIARKSAEMAVLRHLLKVAEAKARLYSNFAQAKPSH